MEQNNIKTTTENNIINLREINEKKHWDSTTHLILILSYELGLFLTQIKWITYSPNWNIVLKILVN